MASPWGCFAPRRTVAALLFTSVVSSAACSDGTSPGPPGPPLQLVEGPLTLEISSPDSSITQRLVFPGLTYSYVCTLTLLARLTGGEPDDAIYWQTADVTWHWLSDNQFRWATVWPTDQLEVFWGSDRMLTGQTKESLVWQFIGTMPYRLDFAFHYMVLGEDSVRTEESAVRCVGPPG